FIRLYNNDGKGNFKLNKVAFPQNVSIISSAVAVADYDADGDIDIFIGGRITPGKYPQSPLSYILQNSNGIFSDVTKQVCPDLQNAGMITAALSTDFNSDKKPDLIICGEWMPIRFFRNDNGILTEVTATTGLTANNGMWRSLQAVDIDNDGDMDYIAGNMGLNNKYHTTPEMPMMLYEKDMDKNGSADLIIAYYIKNNEGKYELFPGPDRNQLSDQIPSIKKKYLLHKEYADVNMEKLTGDYGNDGWTKLTCETMHTVWIENTGNARLPGGQGKFKLHLLPLAAQLAPVNAILPYDINDDGNMDLIIAGNEYEEDAMTGRYDASYGLVLEADGKGNFHPLNIVKSGFIVDGDVKDMKPVNIKNRGKLIVAAVNNDKVKCFALTKEK
ncbi:MAG TPA: VCBS repeat-containing protein, partial [Chitinophagaceae bacterium]